MANPVTHILVPMFIIETYRRYFSKKGFSRWWVFIAGLMGALPDLDIGYNWIMGQVLEEGYHRGVSHSLIIPIITLIVGIVLYLLYSNDTLKNKGFRTSYILLFVATVSFTTHTLLDGIAGLTTWFYPFGYEIILKNMLSTKLRVCILDGALLLAWILYDEEFFNDILQFLKIKN